MNSPALASNWFACKMMRSMTTHGQRIARAVAWVTMGFGFRHGITNTNPPGLVSFFIIVARFVGEKVSHGEYPTANELLWDIVVPSTIAERTAAYFMRRDMQWYGGVCAERLELSQYLLQAFAVNGQHGSGGPFAHWIELSCACIAVGF